LIFLCQREWSVFDHFDDEFWLDTNILKGGYYMGVYVFQNLQLRYLSDKSQIKWYPTVHYSQMHSRMHSRMGQRNGVSRMGSRMDGRMDKVEWAALPIRLSIPMLIPKLIPMLIPKLIPTLIPMLIPLLPISLPTMVRQQRFAVNVLM
jgi:hypothetical protein